MDVHPVLPWEKLKSRHLQLPRSGPDGQPVESSHLEQGKLAVERFGRGMAWIDAGTHDALMQASTFIQVRQKRQQQIIGSPEEVAYRLNDIDEERVMRLAAKHAKSEYGVDLSQLTTMR
jgi:glucose-1-phosphate thymidylyltransferase